MIYIEIVGLDGAGKSTFARSLRYTLGDRSRLLSVSLAEITGEAARSVVTSQVVSPITRALAYMSAHSEVYDRVLDNLEGFDYLIGDRGYACFYAYQFECPSQVIDELWSIAMRDIFPDLLVFIDTPVEICQQRVARWRNPSELDKKPAAWHEAVRERYLAFCQSYKRGEVLILDGSRHPNIQRKRVLKALRDRPTPSC